MILDNKKSEMQRVNLELPVHTAVHCEWTALVAGRQWPHPQHSITLTSPHRVLPRLLPSFSKLCLGGSEPPAHLLGPGPSLCC